jgi:hypothetical protein
MLHYVSFSTKELTLNAQLCRAGDEDKGNNERKGLRMEDIIRLYASGNSAA